MVYVPTETGHWVNEGFARLAEILQDYDPYLELRWIPPDKRTDPDDRSRPYCIVDTRSNYVVRYCSDLDDPVDILANIFDSDNKQHNVLSTIEKRDAAARAFKMKEIMEQQEEAKDVAAFLMRTKQNYIRHNGKLLDDQLRPLRRLK